VDALKALAALCILLHHLVAYGPIGRALHQVLPDLAEALYDYGRMAVQAFLVVGGFLSARALSPRGQTLSAALPEALGKRYLRLVLPFLAAIGITLAVSVVVAPVLPELADLSGLSWQQLLAHVTLTHSVLGMESLTVGAWYVAVDLQLFALLLGVLWLARRVGGHPPRLWLGPALVITLALASAWLFNLDHSLDDTALYFFAAYGLGACVHWLGARTLKPWAFGLLLLSLVAALDYEWRDRLALALAVAVWLALAESGRLRVWGDWARRANESYALFLIHFPVLLLGNALVALTGASDAVALGVAGLCVAASLWVAGAFHRRIELPTTRWASGWVAGASTRWLTP
jgi:peptidoglycan/LPS O-acetylase OafA/YrhL